MNNNTILQPTSAASSHPAPVTSSSPSVAHMRSIAAAAAKRGGEGELAVGGGGHTNSTKMSWIGSDDGVHRPRPQRGFLPSSISKSICTLAMKMVGDDTIRARVADLIPEDFLMVEEVDSLSSSSASPPFGVGGRLAPIAPAGRKGSGGGAFAFTNSIPIDPGSRPHENSSPASAHHHTPDTISPPFDEEEDGDDSYSEWIAILTPSTADGGGLQFPASPTPTTTITTTVKPTAGNNNNNNNNYHSYDNNNQRSVCTTQQVEQQSLSLLSTEGEEGVSRIPPYQEVAPSPPPPLSTSPLPSPPRRAHLRRNVSSLLELNFSLRASPLSTHYIHQNSQPDVGQNNCEGSGAGGGYLSEKNPNDDHDNDKPPHPQRVLSMAMAPPTRLSGGEGEVVTTRSQSAASDDDDDVSSFSSSSSSCDPDLLTSRPHSPTTPSTSSSISSDDEHQNYASDDDASPSRTPHSSNSASPLRDGGGRSIRSGGINPPPSSSSSVSASSSEIGSWFESLFNVVLRSVTSSGSEETANVAVVASTMPTPHKNQEGTGPENREGDSEPSTRGGANVDSQTAISPPSSPLPYFPPNTPTNLLERQFIIAAAYVLNAALIAGVKSADYILGQQQQQQYHQIPHHFHQVGDPDAHQEMCDEEGDRGAGMSISAARLKANRIIQNFVEAAVDVIQHAWFTTHNY